MASLIQKIALLARQTFSKAVTDESFDRLRALFALLSAQDVDFDGDSVSRRRALYAPTIHMNIHQEDAFSLTLFAVRESKSIPLHNHPDMYGIIKVIRGAFKVKSYDLVDLEDVSPPSEGIRKLAISTKYSLGNLRPAIYGGERIISAQDTDTSILKPKENNIHEVTSINGLSAFVDILAPPYDEGVRDCHFFSVLGAAFDTKLGKNVHWLVEIESPQSFWCQSILYTGPPI